MADDLSPAPVPAPPVADPADGTETPSAPGATPPAPPAPTDGDEPLGDGGKKALVAERARAAKAEADLAALRKEIEDSKKTAEQRAADDLKAAQDAAAKATATALRYEVAAEAGIPLALASRLTGSTREEIEADAVNLKALIPAGATPPAPRPQPDPGQGARPGEQPTDDAVYEQYAASMKLPSSTRK